MHLRRAHRTLPLRLVPCALLLASSAAGAQATFQATGVQDVIPTDMTADGSLLVCAPLFGGATFSYDTTNGLVDLMGNGGIPAVSADGSVFAGDVTATGGVLNAGVRSATGPWQGLGSYPGVTTGCPDLSNVYEISKDGQVVVGLGWNGCTATAFRWDAVNGMVDLGPLGPGSTTRANGVDEDGDVIVGWGTAAFGNRTPAIWVNGVGQLLGSLDPFDPATGPGEAQAVSDDGSIVYGESNGSTFRWTAGGGLEDLGKLPGSVGADAAIPLDVSADGTVVVGSNGNAFFGTPQRAFYYTDATGMLDLKTYLNSLGAAVPANFTLDYANACSADGSVVTGWGFNGASGRFELWTATIAPVDPPCGGNEVATAVFRTDAAGQNRTTFTATPPVMGQLWTGQVDNTGTGSTVAGVVAYAGALDLPTVFGSLLVDVTDPAGELLLQPLTPGAGLVDFSVSVPLDAALCGFAFSAQGIAGGGGAGIVLLNAYDCVLGDV